MVMQVTSQNEAFAEKTNEELLLEYKKTGSLEIKQELTVRYIYIVRSVALQMKNIYSGFAQIDDIINEGVITLMTAIDKYDIDKNVKFSTFISKRLRGMIIDLARKQDWVPRGIRKNAMEIDEATMALYGKNGRMPTSGEIAEYMQVPADKFDKMLEKSNFYYVLSLDMILEESMENKKKVQLPSHNTNEQPEEHYVEEEVKEILAKGIETLTDNEKLVVSLLYEEELSAKEIAQMMHISAPRISQIHANAIRKLKVYMESTAR